jgi:hypothetical protein
METRPGEDLGGGASRAVRQPAAGAADSARSARLGTKASFFECSGEYTETGAMAAFFGWIRQQEASMPMPGIGQTAATPRQQAGRPPGCVVSRQADAGMAVQRTAKTSIKSALFLPQFMDERSPAFIPSIRQWFSVDGDSDHIRDARRSSVMPNIQDRRSFWSGIRARLGSGRLAVWAFPGLKGEAWGSLDDPRLGSPHAGLPGSFTKLRNFLHFFCGKQK